MTKEQYIQEQLKKYKQADTEIQHHMLIIHLLGEIWELKEEISNLTNLENSFNYDLDRMEKSLESGEVSFPQGLSRGERREFIRKQVKARPSGLTLREAFDIVYSENEKAFEELSKL